MFVGHLMDGSSDLSVNMFVLGFLLFLPISDKLTKMSFYRISEYKSGRNARFSSGGVRGVGVRDEGEFSSVMHISACL